MAQTRRLAAILAADVAGYSRARLKADPWVSNSAPKVRALYETTFFAGLRKIGMPEE
jgi:hypothetical protein